MAPRTKPPSRPPPPRLPIPARNGHAAPSAAPDEPAGQIDLAASLAALPPETRAARIASALADAYALGRDSVAARNETQAAPALSGRSREIFDAIRAKAAEARAAGRSSEVTFDQSALGCPGQPWHASVGGDLILDGRYAMPIPDATVTGMRGMGLLEPHPSEAGRLVLAPGESSPAPRR